MKNNKINKIVVCVAAFVMVFAVCTTAFAAGERIEHSGWSKTTYCTTQTVQQKNDTRFYCETAIKTAGSDMIAYVWANRYRDSAILGQLSGSKQFNSGITLNIPPNPTVRVICIRIANNGNSLGKNVYTSGKWVLKS